MKNISTLSVRSTCRLLTFALILVAIVSASCGKSKTGTDNSSSTATYSGTFVPSDGLDTTKAIGTVKATFDSSTLVLSYLISWSSLTSIPVAMHFHDDGPVIVQLSGFPVSGTGNLEGKATFTVAQG
ncbi:MAG TPA: CHRD domain-containing protein, partial [Puia sp.]|nr:CHRD domain-containing protein [Puia sp.]